MKCHFIILLNVLTTRVYGHSLAQARRMRSGDSDKRSGKAQNIAWPVELIGLVPQSIRHVREAGVMLTAVLARGSER